MLRPENREHTGFIDELFQYICDGRQGRVRYSGNYFSHSYLNLMSSAAAGRSATLGRLAGQSAAAGI